ncbi:MAG: CoA ester lyase [Theionarchaea archaeon]|nr:CoA ester lyase [Theionarchaea archaeon]
MIRRSRLYMPGNNPKMIQSGRMFHSDVLLLDLEDSVPLTDKLAARILVREALEHLTFENEVMVRINHFPLGRRDLKEIVCERLDSILYPKCESVHDIEEVKDVLQKLEKNYAIDKEIEIVAVIETAKGCLHCEEIAHGPRVTALTFGAEDFIADIGGIRSQESLFFLKSMVAISAASAGIQALDTVYPYIDDDEGLKKEAEESKKMGFCGKGAIHPRQLSIINSVFTPSQEEIAWAQKVISVMKEAEEKGMASAALDGRMIDTPTLKKARRITAIAEVIS